MKVAWVIGSGGLLGSALCKALQRQGTGLFFPVEPFSWNDPENLGRQLDLAVRSFAADVGPAGQWQIYWAAGVGTMGSSASALQAETDAFQSLLSHVAANPLLTGVPGALALASSAGAIYAGASDAVVTEHTAAQPTTAYAQAKLDQEGLLQSFAASMPVVSALAARISTLYGPAHSPGKPQGLIAHIARSILRNRPVQIYVPYDTIRDYITADDAAAAIVETLQQMSGTACFEIRIIASELPATIAEIVSIFKRIAGRPARIATGRNRLTGLYPRRVQFRSLVGCGAMRRRTSLVVGIAQVLAAERAAFVRCASPPVEGGTPG
jgi:UDP-glucose 4-epimerase